MPPVFDAANMHAPHTQREMGDKPSAPTDPAPQLPYKLSQAEQDILNERRGQVTREGYFPSHDDQHVLGELGLAAALYALPYDYELGGEPLIEQEDHIALDVALSVGCSFDLQPEPDERRRKVKAAALLIAEVERIDRAAAAKTQGSPE